MTHLKLFGIELKSFCRRSTNEKRTLKNKKVVPILTNFGPKLPECNIEMFFFDI